MVTQTFTVTTTSRDGLNAHDLAAVIEDSSEWDRASTGRITATAEEH